MNVRNVLSIVLFLFLPIPPLIAFTTAPSQSSATPVAPVNVDLSDPQAMLAQAGAANNLDDLAQAWHLKASYEISGPNGALLDIGTFEEWHLGKYRWKQAYTSDHYKQTEYRTPDGRYFESDSGEPPWAETLVAEELVHPITTSANNPMGPTPRRHPLMQGSVKLDCLSMEPPQEHRSAPIDSYTTYCFGPRSPMLRLRLTNSDLEDIRNQMAGFHNAFVSKDIILLKGGHNYLHIRLTELEGLSPDQVASVIFPAPSKLALPDGYTLPEGAVIGKRLSGIPVKFPDEAKRRHVSGAVILLAHIGKDGHISDVRVVSSPDESLSAASIAAVEKWTYNPFTVKGAPIDVETRITNIFNIYP